MNVLGKQHEGQPRGPGVGSPASCAHLQPVLCVTCNGHGQPHTAAATMLLSLQYCVPLHALRSQLRVLWVSRCGLTSLDGASGFPALRELYAAFNDVADLQVRGLSALTGQLAVIG